MNFLGRLGTQTVPSLWRDVKGESEFLLQDTLSSSSLLTAFHHYSPPVSTVMGDFAYIGSEARGHGIQIFDLKKLLDPKLRRSPKTFSITDDVIVFTNEVGVSEPFQENEVRRGTEKRKAMHFVLTLLYVLPTRTLEAHTMWSNILREIFWL